MGVSPYFCFREKARGALRCTPFYEKLRSTDGKCKLNLVKFVVHYYYFYNLNSIT